MGISQYCRWQRHCAFGFWAGQHGSWTGDRGVNKEVLIVSIWRLVLGWRLLYLKYLAGTVYIALRIVNMHCFDHDGSLSACVVVDFQGPEVSAGSRALSSKVGIGASKHLLACSTPHARPNGAGLIRARKHDASSGCSCRAVAVQFACSSGIM